MNLRFQRPGQDAYAYVSPPDSFTAFVRLAIRTSADQPVSALPLDPIDGEVTLNVAAFARIATLLLPESLLQFIAMQARFELAYVG